LSISSATLSSVGDCASLAVVVKTKVSPKVKIASAEGMVFI
jgi:hypothetical protein